MDNIQADTNRQNTDNCCINVDVFNNTLDVYFFEFWDMLHVDINSRYEDISSNRFCACFKYVYDKYISKYVALRNNQTGMVYYSEVDYFNICQWYIDKCLLYDINSIYGFILLIGINKQTLYNIVRQDYCNNKWVTQLVIDSTKNIFNLYSETSVGKLNDDRTGIIVNANNNNDMGLNYAKQNVINTLTARKMLDIADLPKLE